jgi:hypothetical protein
MNHLMIYHIILYCTLKSASSWRNEIQFACFNIRFINCQTVTWVRPLEAGLWWRKSSFNPMLLQSGYVVEEDQGYWLFLLLDSRF